MTPAPFWVQPMFWLYLSAWAVYTACFLLYGIRSNWQSSGTGRAMMTLYFSLVAILSLVLLIIVGLVPEGPVREVLRSVTLGTVTIAGAVQLSAIFRAQRRDRNKCTDGESHRQPLS